MVERCKLVNMKVYIRVLELINNALDGELSLNDLYKLWPEELSKDKFYETIYNDVESVIEHYPGRLESYFMESHAYKALLVDKQLLNLIVIDKLDSNRLLELKNKLLD